MVAVGAVGHRVTGKNFEVEELQILRLILSLGATL